MSNDFPFGDFLNTGNPENISNKQVLTNTNTRGIFDINPNKNKDLEIETGFSTEEMIELENHVLTELKSSLSTEKYMTYFDKSFKLQSLTSEKATFKTTTSYMKNMIEKQFKDFITRSLFQVFGRDFEVEITYGLTVDSTFSEPANAKFNTNDDKTRSAKDLSFTLDLNPTTSDLKNEVQSKYLEAVTENKGNMIDSTKNFENFVVGPSNNLATASCIALSKNPGKIYPTVYIHSKSGLGKTHLLQAVGNLIKENHPSLKIFLTTAQKFLQEMVEAVKKQKLDDFRRKYTDHVDVLMIDDIHELKGKAGTQDSFFHIFNDLYSKGKQLIFTSDKPPKEISGIEERIKTRLQWGLVLDIQQPDLETRIAILKKFAQKEDIYLPDDVIYLIASSIKDNIRELEGSLIKLAAYSSIFKQDIDVEIAKRELNLNDLVGDQEITMENIAKAVSLFFKIPVADLKSKSRLKEVASARHIAMFLSYKLAKKNLSEIGSFYGKRDHSSVLHGINKIKKSLPTDMILSKDVLEIENNL